MNFDYSAIQKMQRHGLVIVRRQGPYKIRALNDYGAWMPHGKKFESMADRDAAYQELLSRSNVIEGED